MTTEDRKRARIAMISLIEALNYRCLRYVRQPLKPFQVLVGPNASGKTTFLDVLGFLHDLVAEGLDKAISLRTTNFTDLVWRHGGRGFQVAVEAKIPEAHRNLLEDKSFDTVRYEVSLRFHEPSNEVEIVAEQGLLKRATPIQLPQRLLFPESSVPPSTIVTPHGSEDTRRLFSKTRGGNDNYYAEAHPKQGRWRPAFKLGPRKSTLANLPEDEVNFPVSTWLKLFISEGVEKIVLNSLEMRKMSPPGQGTGFKADGSNLPWVVADLQSRRPEQVEQWVRHLRIALRDLQTIHTVLQEDNRNRYVKLVYEDGLEVPSWMASDGTLRLLALTLPAYLRQLKSVYLIEEPENGIHPSAVETMYESLSSVYDAQILMATHSPVILSAAKPEDVLCFAKTHEGATDIVSGDNHPELADWRGEVNLGTLFASGVLG